jgi:hypothetical protein
MAYISSLEPWRYCDVCRTEDTKPFSAERAYKAHLESGTHLKKTCQPPPAYPCPDCNKPFSRADGVKRHQTTSGQCSGPRASAQLPLQSSKKRPLHSELNRVPHKHLKVADQDALQHTTGSASHPTSSTIKQEPGKPGTVTNLSGSDPPLLSSGFRFLREHDQLTYFPGMTRSSEYKSWEQRLSLVSHMFPQARLDHAHIKVQESASHLTDCLEEYSDEDVNVSVGESGTHPASIIFSRAMTPQHPKRVVEVDSGDVIKLLSDAMSSTSIHDAADAVSQAAIIQHEFHLRLQVSISVQETRIIPMHQVVFARDAHIRHHYRHNAALRADSPKCASKFARILRIFPLAT